MRQIHTFFLPFGKEPNFFRCGGLYILLCSNAGLVFFLLGDSSLCLVGFVRVFLFCLFFVCLFLLNIKSVSTVMLGA